MNDALSAPVVAPLPAEWQDWLVADIARGCADADLASVMADNGFDAAQARVIVATVRAMVERARTAGDAPGAAFVAPGDEAVATGSRRLPCDPIRLPPAPRVRAHDREVSIGFALHDPNVALLDDLLSPEECRRLVELATGRLQRSQVVDRASGEAQSSGLRTSEGAHFALGENPVVDCLERRIAALTGVPIDHGEPLQVLHYLPGGEYRPHHDYFPAAEPGSAAHLRCGGQRIATVVVYLADVEEGGETVFPSLRLSIRPRVGSAAYFEYCDRHGEVDPRCLHAGAPVRRGEKWIATKWLRQSPYRPPN